MFRPLTLPPDIASTARFAPGFGQRALLTVDTEEEFDWNAPFTRNRHGLVHIPRLERFQVFCEGLGVSPVYLIDWPIATSPEAVAILSQAMRAGKAEVGVQLHPWVNPPFDEAVTAHNSYAGNLPPALEAAKFRVLRDRIEDAFGTAPLIYRAGRYGLGPNSAHMLREGGIAIDSSVRAHFDYSAGGGPDYGAHPLHPYWADADRALLELPLTTTHWGLLRRQGPWLHPRLLRVPRLGGLAAKMGLLEKIPLTPEDVTVEEALRGIDIALDDGLPLLVLSFHSPSLQPGLGPYVHDEAGLNRFYDWWRRVYTYLDMRDVQPTTVAQILDKVVR
ncbi:MAG: polysaccharide deacetylase family protein [Pontixanthobacter sp.]